MLKAHAIRLGVSALMHIELGVMIGLVATTAIAVTRVLVKK